MDIIESIKSALRMGAEIGDRFDKFNVRSVARGANEQTMTFQACIDDTVPVNFATVLTKNLDRVYASWTQIYLSSVGCIDLNYIKNPRQFIAQYQPNWRFESGEEELDDYEEELKDKLYGDDLVMLSKENPERRITAVIQKGEPSWKLRDDVRKSLSPCLDGINTSGIVSPGMYSEAAGDQNSMLSDMLDNQISTNHARDVQEGLKISKDVRAPKLGDGDIKKLNDMQPYTLELKLLASKGDSAFSQWINYIIGVKTIMHLGSSNSLIKNIVYALKERNPTFNFIRWTTGELSLIKDILLHIDDINFNIANKSDRTGKFITSLKQMKKQYLKVGTFGVNRLAPMATIVISSSTYQIIKNEYGFDLKNFTFAHKLMSELFLMCFVIIDDATQTVDMLVDGQHDFQTYSLETLEREVTLSSNKLGKELTRMLSSNN